MKLFFKILIAVLLIVLILLLKYCCGDKEAVSGAEYLGYNIRLENESPQDFIKRLETGLDTTLSPDDYYVCPCDTTLISLRLGGLTIEGQGPAQVKTPTDAMNLDYSYGKNYVLTADTTSHSPEILKVWASSFFDSTGRQQEYGNPFALTANEQNSSTVQNTVAIFDSGLTEEFLSLNYRSVIGIDPSNQASLCKDVTVSPHPSSGRIPGINFMPDDNSGVIHYPDIADRTNMRHGSKVTQFLAEQRIGSGSAAGLRVLTIKVLNDKNKGDLFSLMCAMSQARKLGAGIFNMSLGYYGPEDKLFRQHVQKLENDKIWLVTAAGNAVAALDDTTAPTEINRDLSLRPDTSKFYPAYFAKDMQHVISVTSVNASDQVCDNQNYSKEAVDIGVLSDNCGFRYTGTGESVRGTSYAAPVVSGWLATKPDLGAYAGKEDLFLGVQTNANLENRIRGGKYIKARGY